MRILTVLLLVAMPGFTHAFTTAEQTVGQTKKLNEAVRSVEQSRWFRALGAGMYVSSAADIGSTEIGMRAGAVEGNALMRNRGVRVSWHVVAPVVVDWMTDKLYAEGGGRRTFAYVLRAIVVGLYSAYTINNVGHF